MDRHDLPGLTAEDLARAHASDLQVADKHDVQFLSYWFDADSGGVFCLARAPAPENLVSVHRESHGLVPNEIISVSEDAVLRFLGVVRNPSNHTEVTSSFRTILFTDIEGSTAIADQLGTSGFIALLTEHDLIIRRALVASRGREVKHTGDGIMASFAKSRMLSSVLLLSRPDSARGSMGARSPSIAFASGWQRGSPSITTTISFGPTVSLARRVCDAAKPGDVLVSDLVHELGTVSGFSFAGVDPRAVKGFAKPVPVFKLLGRRSVQAGGTAPPP